MTEIERVRAIVVEWRDKQGHDRCHWYPELFERLASLLGVEPLLPVLPPRNEFEGACHAFTELQYGRRDDK